jgi:tetratricopeptide (TPR) repeat protein
VGKTQIAIEAAYCVRREHPECSIFWVPAIDAATFESACHDIARNIQINGVDDDGSDVKALVKSTLSLPSSGWWLLIIDNADDAGLLFGTSGLLNYLPSSDTGSVLFTTRSHDVAVRVDTGGSIISVERMERSEARRLLERPLKDHQKRDEGSTMKLLDFLEDLPLAVKQASAFMELQQDISTTDYLEICLSGDLERIELLSEAFEDRQRYNTVQNSVATTWLVSFRRILVENALAADYLRHMCFLVEKDVPHELLPSETTLRTKKALGTLMAYAFLIRRHGRKSYDMHRLVQIAARNWLKESGEWQKWATRAWRRVAEVFPLPRHENRDVWMVYLPHAQSMLQFRDDVADAEEAKQDLTYKAAEALHNMGKYSEAAALHRQALYLRETTFGPEHLRVLESLDSLGVVLRRQGLYKDSMEMHQQALERYEEVGIDHLSRFICMDNLGISLRRDWRFKEAEAIHRKALAGYGRLGSDSLLVLTCTDNLGLALFGQGRHGESEALHRQALHQRQERVGSEHPSTIYSLNNLALAVGIQSKYDEADALLRQGLGLAEKTFGRSHPTTLRVMYNLGVALRHLGKLVEAEMVNRQALELEEDTLGHSHPQTLTALDGLGVILCLRGLHTEAEEVHCHALRLRTERLGRDNPETIRSMNNLGVVLDRRGEYSKAAAVHGEALKLREQRLGYNHPETLESLEHLGAVLDRLGRNEEAEHIRQTWRERKGATETPANNSP